MRMNGRDELAGTVGVYFKETETYQEVGKENEREGRMRSVLSVLQPRFLLPVNAHELTERPHTLASKRQSSDHGETAGTTEIIRTQEIHYHSLLLNVG